MAETKMKWYKVVSMSKKLLREAIARYDLPVQRYAYGTRVDVLGPWNNNPEWYVDIQGNHWHESMFTIVEENTDMCTCDVCIKALRDMCKPLELTIIMDDETISGEDY